jgi:hypothetical protein
VRIRAFPERYAEIQGLAELCREYWRLQLANFSEPFLFELPFGSTSQRMRSMPLPGPLLCGLLNPRPCPQQHLRFFIQATAAKIPKSRFNAL